MISGGDRVVGIHTLLYAHGEPLYQVYQPHHYKIIPQLRKNESQPYLAKPQLCNAKPQL